MVAGTQIKRRVGDRVVKSIRKVYAAVTNQANVASKFDGVLSMDPRNIIRDVVDGRHPGERMGLAIGLEHEAKTYIVPIAVPAIRECLARQAVPQIVYPIVPDGPGVPDSQSSRMAPHRRRKRIG